MMSSSFLLREAAWIFGEAAGSPLSWAITQAHSITEQLTGYPPRMAEQLDGPCGVIVGSPESNPLIRAANLPELADGSALGADDFLVRSAAIDDIPVVYIAGKTDRAAMYGLFAFLEALGCTFLLSRDVLPAANPALVVPPLDLLEQTGSSWRGVWLGSCFATIGILSLPDYARIFDQMAKMRLNRVVYYPFENEPFIDYSYAGERKVVGDTTHPESGYVSLGRGDTASYCVRDMIVGQSLFDREQIAPREFQQVRTSADALDTGREFLRALIRLAKERGIGSWLSFDLAFIALNFAKYLRPMPRPVDLYSSLVSFTDPVAQEINRQRVQSVIDTYPELEGIFFQITEGFYEDRYPDSQAIIAGEWEQYRDALALLRAHWGKWWHDEVQETCLRADIGFVELLKQGIAAAQAAKPGVRMGVLTVCKAYLLTYLHTILPLEMPFIDIESQSLWTVDGAPLHLFQQMRGRECALVPRAYDDGSLAGLQCNLQLYQRDGFVTARREHGTDGLVIQVSHLTGNDHNVRYLAEGMWNESLTPDAFYRAYAETLFGTAAAPAITQAFALLEENEVFLGGRGLKNMPYTFTPPEVSIVGALKGHAKVFLEPGISADTLAMLDERAEKFDRARGYLRDALVAFTQAVDACSDAGKEDLAYLIGKTRAYDLHLGTLMLFRDTFAAYVTAFSQRPHGVPAARLAFRNAVEQARGVEAHAITAAEAFAACVLSPTDLAVTWMMNKTIYGARVLRQYCENILAYYEGREYWNPVQWEMLSGATRHPTYTVEDVETLVLG